MTALRTLPAAPGLDPGVALQLPADAYWHLVRTLRLTLPPPPGVNPGPEDLARRDRAAIARIAALAPANAAEADVAAQFVAASEQWKDCLRLAHQPDTTPEWAAKCRAQAAAMMRQANSALRLLLRMQQARRKLEAVDATADHLAWTEHCALGLMAEALAACPHPGALPKAEQAAAASPLPGREEAGAKSPPDEGQIRPTPGAGARARAAAPELVAAAERYAAAYPERAASIRRTGRLPPDVIYFDPPEAALASALIAARTPALAALDEVPTRESDSIAGRAPAEAGPEPRHGVRAA